MSPNGSPDTGREPGLAIVHKQDRDTGQVFTLNVPLFQVCSRLRKSHKDIRSDLTDFE